MLFCDSASRHGKLKLEFNPLLLTFYSDWMSNGLRSFFGNYLFREHRGTSLEMFISLPAYLKSTNGALFLHKPTKQSIPFYRLCRKDVTAKSFFLEWCISESDDEEGLDIFKTCRFTFDRTILTKYIEMRDLDSFLYWDQLYRHRSQIIQ